MTEDKKGLVPKNIFAGNLNIILVIALTVSAFAMGSLYTKVKYLEGNGGSLVAAKPSAQAPAAAGDTQPKVALKTPELTSDDRIKGNKNAKVTLVEYSDFECPFCIRFHPTMQQVMKEYGDKVKWVYRDYPLSFHANAQKEAEAGWCINELGGTDAFWKYAKDKTTIVIAHRFSTIAKADRIIVMDNGKIIEQGTHKDLVENKDGLYKHLWDLQIEN